MNTIAITAHAPMRSYLLEARCEFLRLLRSPGFVVPTLVFPPLFYLLFGVLLMGTRGGVSMATHMIAAYGVFGVMAPGLFGFGVGIALDRERGFLTLKRALPMPPGALLLAKMAMAMIFATIIAVMLGVLAVTVAGVQLAPMRWAALFLVEVFGVLPFCAIGLLVGTLVGGQGAPAVINLLYLPMAFLGGLWVPLQALPAIFGRLAPLWPSYHLAQIAHAAAGDRIDGNVGVHIAVLLAMTVVFGLLARRRLSRA